MTVKKKIVLTAAISAVVTAAIMSAAGCYAVIYKTSAVDKFEKKISMINRYLEQGYIYDYDEEKMMESAVSGYVAGLDEKYTNYYTPEQFESYNESLQDSYVGIGIVIARNDYDQIEVVAPFEGSSAYEAGVKPGDILTKVDGVEYGGDKMEEAVAKIKSGKEGTTVDVTFVRNGEELNMTIERRRVSSESVKSEMLQNNIGYMRISAFNTSDEGNDEDTYAEFLENYESLKSQGMNKMIIDLRDNPGGSLDVVCNIADRILPEGLITYIEYKDGTRDEYKSDKEQIDMPMVVLINENSASASEVLTGALKDYKKATVIGKKSYGKGVVQSVIPFRDGSGMSMTIARYYSPNGVCIHGTGIEPDIEVDIPEEFADYYASALDKKDDTQLQKAIEVLSK